MEINPNPNLNPNPNPTRGLIVIGTAVGLAFVQYATLGTA